MRLIAGRKNSLFMMAAPRRHNCDFGHIFQAGRACGPQLTLFVPAGRKWLQFARVGCVHVPFARDEARSARQPALRAGAVPVALAGRRLGARRRRGAAARAPAGREAGPAGARGRRARGGRAPPFVSRGGIKLANALDALGLDVGGPQRARRRRLDRRLHRLPAPARRGARGRGRRRLRRARLAAALGPAGDGDRAHQRPRAPARTTFRTRPT